MSSDGLSDTKRGDSDCFCGVKFDTFMMTDNCKCKATLNEMDLIMVSKAQGQELVDTFREIKLQNVCQLLFCTPVVVVGY